MHSSGTYHQTMLERIRGSLDLPSVNSKFLDEYIIAHALMPAMVEVINRLNNSQDNPIILRHRISLVKDQEQYVLPPCIGNVLRFAEIDEAGNVTNDYYPGGLYNPVGPGWYIEGNELIVRPFPAAARNVDIWYVSNGDVLTHYATDGTLKSSTELLVGTPLLGQMDRRENAYAGQVLRVITEDLIEERIIETYDVTAGEVTVRRPFTDDLSALWPSETELPVAYEIAPYGSQPLYDAIALRAAMKLGVAANVSERKREQLKEEYRSAIKAIGDNLTNMQQRTGKFIDKATVDNQDWWLSRLGY